MEASTPSVKREPHGQLFIVPWGAYREGDGTVLNANFKRFFDGQFVSGRDRRGAAGVARDGGGVSEAGRHDPSLRGERR